MSLKHRGWHSESQMVNGQCLSVLVSSTMSLEMNGKLNTRKPTVPDKVQRDSTGRGGRKSRVMMSKTKPNSTVCSKATQSSLKSPGHLEPVCVQMWA